MRAINTIVYALVLIALLSDSMIEAVRFGNPHSSQDRLDLRNSYYGQARAPFPGVSYGFNGRSFGLYSGSVGVHGPSTNNGFFRQHGPHFG